MHYINLTLTKCWTLSCRWSRHRSILTIACAYIRRSYALDSQLLIKANPLTVPLRLPRSLLLVWYDWIHWRGQLLLQWLRYGSSGTAFISCSSLFMNRFPNSMHHLRGVLWTYNFASCAAICNVPLMFMLTLPWLQCITCIMEWLLRTSLLGTHSLFEWSPSLPSKERHCFDVLW